jgi:serine/threonine-protein kinase
MATVYLARLAGEAGFNRLYAVKVMHAHLSEEPAFVSMLLDEARLAARLHHPNVVPVVDLGTQGPCHYIVLEYVEGCALSALYRGTAGRPPRLVVPVILDALAGLHAAHVLLDEDGNALNLVHRDVSPQNVLIGADGAGRITDFGVARAESRLQNTRPGELKGKLAYLAPEQVMGGAVDARSDVFAAGVMLWSSLTGRKLFTGDSDAATLHNVLHTEVPPPSLIGFQPPAALDAVCLKALERDPNKRFASAEDMEEALRNAAQAAGLVGTKKEVAEWVTTSFANELAERREAVRASLQRSRGAATHVEIKLLPTVGEATPSSIVSPNIVAAGAPSESRGPNDSTSPSFIPGTTPTAAAPAPKRSPVPMVIGLLFAAMVAVAASFAMRSPPAPTVAPTAVATSAPAVVPTPSSTATAAPAPTTETVVAAAVAPSAAPTATASPAVTAASKPAVVAPRATPQSAQPAAAKPTRAWDPNSALPPQ